MRAAGPCGSTEVACEILGEAGIQGCFLEGLKKFAPPKFLNFLDENILTPTSGALQRIEEKFADEISGFV
jgi:hypothetical protein